MPRLVCYAWAFPTTLVGLVAGALTLCSGGQVQARLGALEFYGGFARWFANRIGFGAMTLGHVIIGSDPWTLHLLRDHEQAHVRQAERWAPHSSPLTSAPVSWHGGAAGITIATTGLKCDARRATDEVD